MKADILAIGVHPDDVELSCSGTLLKHIAAGRSVVLLDLTRGELGTRGNAELRTEEAMASAKLMGVLHREQLAFKDAFFVHDEKHLKELVTQIRRFRPEIVLCNAIADRHPDHGRSANLVAEACFYSGLVKIETRHASATQEPWRPKAVYHYIQDNYLQPDFVVDVSPYVDLKLKAIMTFSSQFYNPASTEPETPISTPQFIESIKGKMALWGRQIGVPYAEGFTVRRTPGVNDLFDLL